MKKWFVIFCASLFLSCNFHDLNPKAGRIYVLQEIKLDSKNILFWFEDAQQITHTGMNYFQITDDRCQLSISSANVRCNLPLGILGLRNDTIYILSDTEVIPINPDKRYKIVQSDSTLLFDPHLKPKNSEKYFLDSLCNEIK